MSDDIAAYLKQYDEEFEEIEVKEGGGGGLPDGTYQAKVKICRVEEADWGDTQLFLMFEDLGGKGTQGIWDNLDHEVGRSIAKSHLSAMGWSGKLSELPGSCASGFFDDLVVDIRVKDNHKDDKVYKAVYINKLYGKAGSVQEVAEGDDDFPF